MYKNNKVTIMIVSLVIGLSICVVYNFNLRSDYLQLYEESEDLTSKLNLIIPINKLIESTIAHPETIYSNGLKIVSGSYVQVNKRDNVAFFIPYNDTTLKMKVSVYPDLNLNQRLFLQGGNAYRNESSKLVGWHTSVEQIGANMINSNITVWQTQIIWDGKVNNGETYDLDVDEGWYTLSWGGPVKYSSSGLEWESDIMYPISNDSVILKAWVDFYLIKDGNKSPFIIESLDN